MSTFLLECGGMSITDIHNNGFSNLRPIERETTKIKIIHTSKAGDLEFNW